MNKEKADRLLKGATFITAKSMPENPHQYSLRETWENDEDFVNVVLFIRANGIEQRFWRKKYIYYYLDGYKYWTMGCPTHNDSKTGTILINKKKII